MAEPVRLVLDCGDNECHQSTHHFRLALRHLVSHYGYRVVSMDELTAHRGQLREHFASAYGGPPDCLVADRGVASFADLADELGALTRLCFLVDDIHHGKSLREQRRRVFRRSYALFLTYEYLFARYYGELPARTVWWPHSAAYEVAWNRHPAERVLLTGHLNAEVYPDRQFVYEQSRRDPRVVYHAPDYRGYVIREEDRDKTYGERFYRLLSEYLCCVTDESDRSYLIAKFFEIAAAGSLLLAFNESTRGLFAQLGFEDGRHYFSVTRDNFLQRVAYVLAPEHREEVDRMRLAGQRLVRERHTYRHRAEQLHRALTESIEQSP